MKNSGRRSWMHRYVSLAALLVIAYIVYLFFFSEHSVMHKIEYQQTIDSLNAKLEATRDSVEYYHNLNTQLQSDRTAIERVVREQHNMNRDDEDVYIMTPSK